jgi:hypothetical protein
MKIMKNRPKVSYAERLISINGLFKLKCNYSVDCRSIVCFVVVVNSNNNPVRVLRE